MSVNWLSAAWVTETGSPSRKAVLIALADRCGEEGTCWPSYRDLMERTELSRSSIVRAVEELVLEGLIEAVHRARANGSRTSNGYRLLIPDIRGGVTMTPGGAHSDTGGGVTMTPPEPSVEPSEGTRTVRRRGATSQRRSAAAPAAEGKSKVRQVHGEDTGGEESPALGSSPRKSTAEAKAVAEERGTSGYGLALRLQRGLTGQRGDRAIVDCRALAKRLNERHEAGESRAVQAAMIASYVAAPERYSTGDFKGWTGFLAAAPKLAADSEKMHRAEASAEELYSDPYEGLA